MIVVRWGVVSAADSVGSVTAWKTMPGEKVWVSADGVRVGDVVVVSMVAGCDVSVYAS